MLFDKRAQLDLFNSQAEKRYNSIDELRNIALDCSRCALREDCTQVVFGAGNKEADLMFVGEAPGRDEDQQGTPFVGQAGILLEKILTAADINKEEVYISNVVKCRPPDNRKPDKKEMKTCLWILAQEIKLVNPKLIVPLGSTALKGLIYPRGKITKLRGQWIERKDKYFLPTFHPAALLRDETKKPLVWKDFLKLKKAYDKYLRLKAEGKEV